MTSSHAATASGSAFTARTLALTPLPQARCKVTLVDPLDANKMLRSDRCGSQRAVRGEHAASDAAHVAGQHRQRRAVGHPPQVQGAAVSSMAGFVAYPGFPGYAAAKHGVNGLVKGMSLSIGSWGIRANALCPAHGMSVNFALPPDAEVLGRSYEEIQPWDPAASSIPLKLGRPPSLRDNANAALFLVSDESAYVSRVCLPATDGGNLARTSIVFPGDLGGDAGVLPERLAAQLDQA